MNVRQSASTPATRGAFSPYEKFVVAVLAFLQFTIILDFMMLAPLGPLVMPALHITPTQFGWVVSTYAFSAGASGLLAADFLDRFDRKKLLIFFYCGFVVGTLLCGLANNFPLLLLARMVTGLFAGVVGSVCFAIVTDLFPLHMRGRVMGILQTAFAASTVLGIPLALYLSNKWSWNVPFFMVVAVSAVVGGFIQAYLRPVNEHLEHHPDRSPLHHLVQTLSNPRYGMGFVTTGLLSVGGFMLMPFNSVFTVNNLGLSLEQLPLLYIVTGIFSIVAGPAIGWASDTVGKLKVFAFGCVMTIAMVLLYTHLHTTPFWELCVLMVLLQTGIFSRMISSSSLLSALPTQVDRGAYMSISSSLQQIAGGVASVIAGMIVTQRPDGSLQHFEILGYLLSCSTLLCWALMHVIGRRIAREQSTAMEPEPAAATASAHGT